MQILVVEFGNKRVEIAYSENTFDKAVTELENKGYGIISLEENAKLRIKQGKNSFISNTGNFVKEGVIYIPNKGRFITKNSPILENPKEATYSHKNEKDFYITDEQAEKALENSVKVPYHVCTPIKGIPTKRFGEEEIINFCFGKTAKDYGLFLEDAGIYEVILHLNKKDDVNEKEGPYKRKGPFANQLSFNGLDRSSYLLGFNHRMLAYDRGEVCGILKANRKNNPQKAIPLEDSLV